MKNATTVIQTRDNLNNKIHKIRQRINEVKCGKRLNELCREDQEEWKALIVLKGRYEDYVTALNFSLNEDDKLNYFSEDRYFQCIKEYTCEKSEQPKKTRHIENIEVDWVEKEKNQVNRFLRYNQRRLGSYNKELNNVYFTEEGVTLELFQRLERRYGNKKEICSRIKFYEKRLEQVEKGIRPKYLLSGR